MSEETRWLAADIKELRAEVKVLREALRIGETDKWIDLYTKEKQRAEAAEARLKKVEKERDEYLKTLDQVETRYMQYRGALGVAEARAERLQEGVRWLLPLLDPMNMTPSEHEVYEALAADTGEQGGES